MLCVNIYFTSCFGELLTSFLEQVVHIMMTWTRASLSCDTVFTQLIGSIYGRGMLMEECVREMQQRLRAAPLIKEACKVRPFTAKSRGYQRSQEGIGRGERSWWQLRETIMRILRMRYVFSTQTSDFLFRTYTDAPPPPMPAPLDRICLTLWHNNCRSTRRCRSSRNSASGGSRSGRPRDQAEQRVSQKYH